MPCLHRNSFARYSKNAYMNLGQARYSDRFGIKVLELFRYAFAHVHRKQFLECLVGCRLAPVLQWPLQATEPHHMR